MTPPRLLLDSHALAWWLLADPRLSDVAKAAIGRAKLCYVSPVSAWEMATKCRLGKWADIEPVARDIVAVLRQASLPVLDITLAHADRAGWLPGPHRDPWDRMLIAQCHAEDLAIVSADAVFDTYGVRRVW